MTGRPPLLVRVLNSALGLDLADFTEARVFLRSPEGDALIEEWLAVRRNEVNKLTNDPVTTTAPRSANVKATPNTAAPWPEWDTSTTAPPERKDRVMTERHDDPDQPDMEELAASDVDRAHERLYYAARRYCAIIEQSFLQQASNVSADDPSFVSYGDAANDLAEAGHRYTEAYARWETFLPDEESEDDQ